MEALHDIEPLRVFAGVEPGDDRIADDSTLQIFRPLLERDMLADKLIEAVDRILKEKGFSLGNGIVAGARIINISALKRNEPGARDLGKSTSRKANGRHFRMKARIGVEAQASMAHGRDATSAQASHVKSWDRLLHGEESSVRADKGFASEKRGEAYPGRPRPAMEAMREIRANRKLSEHDRHLDRRIAKVRARIERASRASGRRFRYAKSRKRRIAQNRALHFTQLAPSHMRMLGWGRRHDGEICPKFPNRNGNGPAVAGNRFERGASRGSNCLGSGLEATDIHDRAIVDGSAEFFGSPIMPACPSAPVEGRRANSPPPGRGLCFADDWIAIP